MMGPWTTIKIAQPANFATRTTTRKRQIAALSSTLPMKKRKVFILVFYWSLSIRHRHQLL
jgi:hypothetical protein